MELVENYETPLLTQMSRGKATAEYNYGANNHGIYFYCHLIPAPGWDDDPLSFEGQKTDALFVGHWAAPILLLGIYNKLVKLHGSDRFEDGQ